MLDQVEVGRHRATLFRERVHVERATVGCVGGLDHALHRCIRNSGLTEDRRDVVFLHELDSAGNLLRSRLVLGVHRPNEALLQPSITCHVGKRPFAGHQRTALLRQLGQLLHHSVVDLLELILVILTVALKVGGVLRIKLREGCDHVVNVGPHLKRAHPRVRVRQAGTFVLGDVNRGDAVRHGDVRCVAVLHELREPVLQVQAVIQDEVRVGRATNIRRRWLIAVDFSARLGQGLNREVLSRHILRDVLDHREGGQHRRLLRGLLFRRRCTTHQQHCRCGKRCESPCYSHFHLPSERYSVIAVSKVRLAVLFFSQDYTA